jgi:Flp pilus assembly pilin Flp
MFDRLFLKVLVLRNKGQGIIEYAIIAALISIVAIAIILGIKAPLLKIWSAILSGVTAAGA